MLDTLAARLRPIGRRIVHGARLVVRRAPRRRRPHGPQIQSPSFVVACGLVLALTSIAVVDPLLRHHPGIADGSFADRTLTALTSFGEGVEMLVGSLALLLAVSSVDPRGLARRTRAGLIEIGATAAHAFLAVAGSGLLAALVKNAYGRARPEHLDGDAVFQLHAMAFRAKYASFPSGHSTTAGATAVVLALLFPRHARVILALGLVVALTRILLDAHFPSDVAAGLTLGAAVALILAHAFARRGLVFAYGADGALVPRPLARPMAWFDTLAGVLARRPRPEDGDTDGTKPSADVTP